MVNACIFLLLRNCISVQATEKMIVIHDEGYELAKLRYASIAYQPTIRGKDRTKVNMVSIYQITGEITGI